MADPVPAPTVDREACLHDESWSGRHRIEDGRNVWQCDGCGKVGTDYDLTRDKADGYARQLRAARAEVSRLVAELSVSRAREAQVRKLAEPKPANLGDQCRNCGDRRLHHRPGACDLCGFCGGFAARLPLIDADALLAVLDGTTGSGKTG